MGQEINASRFTAQDFSQFLHNLREETGQLADYFRQQRFSSAGNIGGFELEAWLIRCRRPVPHRSTRNFLPI
ncbi:MAG: hypothetical protein U5P41_01430 [Gammaproteobacteria bacterium]|nr:hypothetical protein [Gammaproteobacteria bacterium]